MGLSVEGYRTGGRTELRVDLILLHHPPDEEEVLLKMREVERGRREGKRLPLFKVKWVPDRMMGIAYGSQPGQLGMAGAFGLMDMDQIPLLEAVKRLGHLWVECIVDGEEDEMLIEREESAGV